MGAYQYSPDNPPVMEGGKRNPLPPSGGDDDSCHCAAIMASPRFMRPMMRRLFAPRCVPTITERDLHPNVDRVVTALLDLQDAVSDVRAENGERLRLTFTNPTRDGDDFRTELRIRCGEEEAFAGSLTAYGVWRRGKVSFAHAIIGAVELLYLHFMEMGARKTGEVEIKLGVLELTGTASNVPVLSAMMSDEIVVALQKQSGGGPGGGGGGTCEPGGLFDPLVIYGAFPSGGYRYFFGINADLVEERLDGRGIV